MPLITTQSAKGFGFGALTSGGGGGSFDWIATTTASGTTATLSLGSIPQTYSHLRIIATTKSTYNSSGVGESYFKIQMGNGSADTGNNYYFGNYRANAASSVIYNNQNAVSAFWSQCPWLNSASMSGYLYDTMIMDIIDYTSTSKLKQVRWYNGYPANSTSGNSELFYRHGTWNSTAAVNTLLLDSSTPFADGEFAVNSTFTLYGVK